MPRQSAEARGASIYLAGTKPLPVPKSLKPAASRRVWLATVNARPADYFGPGDVPLLERWCTLSARAREVEALLASTPADAPDAAAIERRLLAISTGLAGLAQRLRLTVVQRIERHSGQRSEAGPGTALARDGLLGARGNGGIGFPMRDRRQ
jgi:hypothetical protein